MTDLTFPGFPGNVILSGIIHKLSDIFLSYALSLSDNFLSYWNLCPKTAEAYLLFFGHFACYFFPKWCIMLKRHLCTNLCTILVSTYMLSADADTRLEKGNYEGTE